MLLGLLILADLTLGSASAAPKAVEVHGHRGARAAISENSLPAFEYAWRHGADVLEMDLAVTRDGKLVISHDPRIQADLCVAADGSRLPASPPIFIHDLDLAQVEAYDCGSIQNPR